MNRLRDAVAAHFRAHPGEWVSMQTLAGIAGTGGWRTRKNECERELGMRIENRQYRMKLADGRTVTCSKYRFVPAPQTLNAVDGGVVKKTKKKAVRTMSKERAVRIGFAFGRKPRAFPAHLATTPAEWRDEKRQEWREVEAALARFNYGSAYTPEQAAQYRLGKLAQQISEAVMADGWVAW